jgi:hypothetical protein
MTPGCFKESGEDDDAEQATQDQKPGESPGREDPRGQQDYDSYQYPTATVKSNSSVPHWTERTDLRRADRHSSRHDIRAACHCGPEGHE